MDMPNPNANETPSTPTAPAPQSPAPTITPEIQALIEAARAEGRNSGAAETRRAFEARQQRPQASAPQPAAQPRAESNTPDPATPDPLAILKLRDDFDDATADLALAAPQRRFLREQVMTQRPPDVAAFVRGFVDVWGAKPAAPAATTTNVTNPAPATPAQPATPMPGTTPPVTVTADTPLTSLGKSDLDAAIRRLGPHEFAKRWFAELASTGKRISVR